MGFDYSACLFRERLSIGVFVLLSSMVLRVGCGIRF